MINEREGVEMHGNWKVRKEKIEGKVMFCAWWLFWKIERKGTETIHLTAKNPKVSMAYWQKWSKGVFTEGLRCMMQWKHFSLIYKATTKRITNFHIFKIIVAHNAKLTLLYWNYADTNTQSSTAKADKMRLFCFKFYGWAHVGEIQRLFLKESLSK